MASAPITLYSYRVDPESVLEIVQRIAPKVKVSRNGETWTEINAIFPRGAFRKPLILKLFHDPDYYLGEGWEQQHVGMLSYFSQIPMDEERAPIIMRLVASLKFCVGSIAKPGLDSVVNDPRLDLLSAIATNIDGCIFTPNGLLDRNGRSLISVDGSFSEDAVVPSHPVADGFDDDEGIECAPPDATKTAKRMLVLAAVAGRGVLEMQCRQGHTEVAENFHRIQQWVEVLGLRDECEPEEWKRIITPVQELSDQQMIDSIWRLEGLTVLHD